MLDLGTIASNPEPVEILPSADGERLVVTWSDGASSWTLFERRSDGTYEPRQTVLHPAGVSLAVPYSWLDDHRVMIPASVTGVALDLPPGFSIGYVPAIVDFTTGEVRPLAAFADPAVVGRGNLVVGID